MTRDDDFIGHLEGYLDDYEGSTPLPYEVRDAIRAQLPSIQQRPAWWPARRFPHMNNAVRIALAAAAVVVIAFLGIRFLLPGQNIGPPGPTTTPTPSPVALRQGTLPAATYVIGPALEDTFMACPEPTTPECTSSMRLMLTVPDGWAGAPLGTDIWLFPEANSPPDGAGLIFTRGAWLYSDPCRRPDTTDPDMEVGPTVDDFASALADHPLLEVTTPVDVTLAGYSGKYVDLQVPLDISQCNVYRPWDPGLYAQGPGHRWHLWILDVDGQRVVVQTTDYAGTSQEHQDELQVIVDSIQIEP